MDAADRSPAETIQVAAQRLADHMAALRDAHEVHRITPGPYDDLTSPEYMAAAAHVYLETLTPDYLRLTGMTFGAVAVLMDLVADQQPQRTTQAQWLGVRGYLVAAAEQFSPDYRARLDELPSLALAAQPTPPIVRFDLLAQLASRAAVLRNLDAANWVAELADELPELLNARLTSAQLVAFAVRGVSAER